MKWLRFAILMILCTAVPLTACEDKDGNKDASEEECPGAPPPGNPCETIGQTCSYSTSCGTMYCECKETGSWSCTGGHYCDADSDG